MNAKKHADPTDNPVAIVLAAVAHAEQKTPALVHDHKALLKKYNLPNEIDRDTILAADRYYRAGINTEIGRREKLDEQNGSLNIAEWPKDGLTRRGMKTEKRKRKGKGKKVAASNGKKSTSERKQVLLFGKHSVVSVIRWMGSKEWKFDKANKTLAALGAGDIAEATVRIQLRAGKTGKRGPAAKLSKIEEKQLKTAGKPGK